MRHDIGRHAGWKLLPVIAVDEYRNWALQGCQCTAEGVHKGDEGAQAALPECLLHEAAFDRKALRVPQQELHGGVSHVNVPP